VTKQRLDSVLTGRGLARSRSHAAQLIADGLVRVDGSTVIKASAQVGEEQQLSVDEIDRYVSRGAGKLIAALDAFRNVVISERLALDAGASTGGFTQVLLERGARHVIAVDVGHGQLSPVIAADARVSVVEGYNIRYAFHESLELSSGVHERPGLVVADLSFISLTNVLPALVEIAESEAEFVVLIKPQFEVGRTGIREGVVKNPGLRADSVMSVLWAAYDLGLRTAGVIASPVIGNAGNHEYLAWLTASTGSNPTEWLDRVGTLAGV